MKQKRYPRIKPRTNEVKEFHDFSEEYNTSNHHDKEPGFINAIHQTSGNMAVFRMLNQGQIIQPKLKVSTPGDTYEQEADRIAEQIVNMPEPITSIESEIEGDGLIQTKPIAKTITPMPQRKIETEDDDEILDTESVQNSLKLDEEDEEELLQRKSRSEQPGIITSDIEAEINSSLAGGRPLSRETRDYFEPRFGIDFSDIRIHTNSLSSQLSDKINARAFTINDNIFFNEREYCSDTENGKRLLGHELTHVVQQNKKKSLNKSVLRKPQKKDEHEVKSENEGESDVPDEDESGEFLSFTYKKIIEKHYRNIENLKKRADIDAEKKALIEDYPFYITEIERNIKSVLKMLSELYPKKETEATYPKKRSRVNKLLVSLLNNYFQSLENQLIKEKMRYNKLRFSWSHKGFQKIKSSYNTSVELTDGCMQALYRFLTSTYGLSFKTQFADLIKKIKRKDLLTRGKKMFPNLAGEKLWNKIDEMLKAGKIRDINNVNLLMDAAKQLGFAGEEIYVKKITEVWDRIVSFIDTDQVGYYFFAVSVEGAKHTAAIGVNVKKKKKNRRGKNYTFFWFDSTDPGTQVWKGDIESHLRGGITRLWPIYNPEFIDILKINFNKSIHEIYENLGSDITD